MPRIAEMCIRTSISRMRSWYLRAASTHSRYTAREGAPIAHACCTSVRRQSAARFAKVRMSGPLTLARSAGLFDLDARSTVIICRSIVTPAWNSLVALIQIGFRWNWTSVLQGEPLRSGLLRRISARSGAVRPTVGWIVPTL